MKRYIRLFKVSKEVFKKSLLVFLKLKVKKKNKYLKTKKKINFFNINIFYLILLMTVSIKTNDYPWRKNRKIILYDLFSGNVIPCLSANRNTNLCIGPNCPLAHLNDLYDTALQFCKDNNKYTDSALIQFKQWNHYEYEKYLNNNKQDCLFIIDFKSEQYNILKNEQNVMLKNIQENIYNKWLYHKLMSDSLHELLKKNDII